MITQTAELTALEDRQVPVQAKLAAAWTSFMFLYIYVDYLALYKPGFLDEILAGIVHEFDTGPTFVALALTLMAIPILMIWLSMLLPARARRPGFARRFAPHWKKRRGTRTRSLHVWR